MTISEEHLQPLRDIGVKRIQDAAADGRLEACQQMAYVLYRWRKWAGDGPPRQFVAKMTASDQGLARLLEGFLQPYATHTDRDKTARQGWRVRTKDVADFVADTSALCKHAAEILRKAPRWLTPRQRTALEAFVDECRNPDRFRD